MEKLNYFVSSRGLLQSTTNHNQNPRSSSPEIDLDLISRNESVKSIYVCTEALEKFSNEFLKNIHQKFNLVTGDSDIAIDADFLDKEPIKRILEHPHINRWFAQNLNCNNPKISHLPIGVDYHTMWGSPGQWGLTKQSSIAQERGLIDVLGSSKDTVNRYFVGYCNWQFAMERGNRQQCYEAIQQEFCFFEPTPTPRMTSWQRQANCMFVVSPQGFGLDCHRTWEAMLLGCVPIVKKSIYTELLNDLPVIQLGDWSECNQKNIELLMGELKVKRFNYSKLFLQYWSSLINDQEPLNLDLMTMQEFKEYICHISY
jgi:hypothetical protein